jgi:hypothetical protein
VPDHSWLSRTRARLPLEMPDAVFPWVLQRLAERGLVKGECGFRSMSATGSDLMSAGDSGMKSAIPI